MKAVLGIDWGGTYIKAGVVNYRGKIEKKLTFTSKNLRQKEVFIQELKRLIKELKEFSISGVGIGAPGIVDTKKGFIYYLPNVRGWENYPLGRVLRKELKIPVFIDNDANMFALAESRFGAAKGLSPAICLTLGTGLGGAVVIDGELLNTEISAQELGHVPIALAGQKCACGSRGCIETYTGNKRLLRRYKQLKSTKHKNFDVEYIFQRALKGERAALIVWGEFSFHLGKFLSGLINLFNPKAIILGGGVSGAFKLFKPLVLKTIKENSMWPNLKGLKLLKAKLNNPGIIGSALLVKDKLASV
jgi:glucokinase